MLSVPPQPQNPLPTGYEQQGPSTSQPYSPQVPAQQQFYQQRMTASPLPRSPSRVSQLRGNERVQRWANPYPQAGQYAPSPTPSMISHTSDMDMSMISIQSYASQMSHASQNPVHTIRRNLQQPHPSQPSPVPSENIDPAAQNRMWQQIEHIKTHLQGPQWTMVIEQEGFWSCVSHLVSSKEFMACNSQILYGFLEVYIRKLHSPDVKPMQANHFLTLIWWLMTNHKEIRETFIKIYSQDRNKLNALIALMNYPAIPNNPQASNIYRHNGHYAFQIIFMLAHRERDGIPKVNEEILAYLRSIPGPGQILFEKFFVPSPGIQTFQKGNLQRKGDGVKFLLRTVEVLLERSLDDEVNKIIGNHRLIETIIGRVFDMDPEVFGHGIKIVQAYSHLREIKKVDMAGVFLQICKALERKEILNNEVILCHTVGFLMNATANHQENKVKLLGTGNLVSTLNWLEFYSKKANLNEADLIDNMIGVISNLAKTPFTMDPKRFSDLYATTNQPCDHLEIARIYEGIKIILSKKYFQETLFRLLRRDRFGNVYNLSNPKDAAQQQLRIKSTTLMTKARIVRLINVLVSQVKTDEWTIHLNQVVDEKNLVDILHDLAFLFKDPPLDSQLFEDALKLEADIFELFSTIYDHCPALKLHLENLFKLQKWNPFELSKGYELRESKCVPSLICAILDFCKRIFNDREVVQSFANYQSKFDELSNSGYHEIQSRARDVMAVMGADQGIQLDPFGGLFSRGYEDDVMES
ncbi:unnamed protein product, partial [Mesorhabditis belari]|uniref:Uncharacterized protein n=1 Tax=Mesorhabditis belari TaxID=2138241 RepID=A0AAF3FIV8_9BILA